MSLFEEFDINSALAALHRDDNNYAAAFEIELAKARAEGHAYFAASAIAAAKASEGDGGRNEAETARYAALDAERSQGNKNR
jgi:hypothetical protein